MAAGSIKFGHRSNPFFDLSPYYFSTFEFDNLKWRTLIHAWCGAYVRETTQDYDKMNFIRNRNSPIEAYRMTKAFGMGSLGDLRHNLFLFVLGQYMKQNERFRGSLLITGNTPLIYTVKGDDFLYRGNRYGLLLEGIRSKLT